MTDFVNHPLLLGAFLPPFGRSVLRLQYRSPTRTDSSVIIRFLSLDELGSLADERSALVFVVIFGFGTVGILGALLGWSCCGTALFTLRGGLGLGGSVCVIACQSGLVMLPETRTHWVQWGECCHRHR